VQDVKATPGAFERPTRRCYCPICHKWADHTIVVATVYYGRAEHATCTRCKSSRWL